MGDTIDLGDRLDAFVDRLVADGRYPSREAALQESVRLLEVRERKIDEFDAAIERGLADARAGRVRSIDDVFDRLEAKYQAMAHQVR